MFERSESTADGLNPADRELEAALMALKPSPAAVDSADAFFEAGRQAAERSARRQMRVWRGITCVFAVALGGSILLRSPPTVVERERIRVVVQEPAEGNEVAAQVATGLPVSGSLSSESMFALRRVALERGIEHLPASEVGHPGYLRLRGVAIP